MNGTTCFLSEFVGTALLILLGNGVVANVLLEKSGIPKSMLPEVLPSSGASANDFLMQFQSDVIGVPVERPECVETTALGAAYLAGLATGFWSGPSELKANVGGLRRFTPSIGEGERSAALSGWHAAVARVRGA